MAPSLRTVGVLMLCGLTLAAAAVVAETLWGSAGWPRHQLLAAEVAAIEAENSDLAQRLALLERQVTAQNERPEVQEALVRDLLGYVRSGDVVIRLERETAPARAPQANPTQAPPRPKAKPQGSAHP